MPHPDTWLCVHPEGLFCDPIRPGHDAAPETLTLMQIRMGEALDATKLQPLKFSKGKSPCILKAGLPVDEFLPVKIDRR